MNRHTVQRGVVVAVLVLVAISAAGWLRAGGSDSDAQDLKEQIRGMDGVASVMGGYEESQDIPFAGSSTFVVAMEPEAATDDVVDVVATAYDEFGTLSAVIPRPGRRGRRRPPRGAHPGS